MLSQQVLMYVVDCMEWSLFQQVYYLNNENNGMNKFHNILNWPIPLPNNSHPNKSTYIYY